MTTAKVYATERVSGVHGDRVRKFLCANGQAHLTLTEERDTPSGRLRRVEYGDFGPCDGACVYDDVELPVAVAEALVGFAGQSPDDGSDDVYDDPSYDDSRYDDGEDDFYDPDDRDEAILAIIGGGPASSAQGALEANEGSDPSEEDPSFGAAIEAFVRRAPDASERRHPACLPAWMS